MHSDSTRTLDALVDSNVFIKLALLIHNPLLILESRLQESDQLYLIVVIISNGYPPGSEVKTLRARFDPRR